jgi:hypothetical protein
LHFSGSPTNSGTIWVSLDITGRPAARARLDARGALLVALALPARRLEVPDRGGRAAQIAGGSAVVKMKPGA